MKRISIIILTIIIIKGNGFSQIEDPFVPPTPNVSALAKHIDIPTTNSYGLVDISIPITEISEGNISIPITLSYHHRGIKVGEIASWVGLGWSLSGEMFVTRTVRGIKDDIYNKGYYYNPIHASNLLYMGEDKDWEINLAVNHENDFESDEYYFSLGEINGKFYYDQDNGTFYTKPLIPGLKIEPILETGFEHGFKGWIFTLGDGTVYYFGVNRNGSRELSYNPESVATFYYGGDHGGTKYNYVNDPRISSDTWKLLEIVSANEKNKLEFYYHDYLPVEYFSLVNVEKAKPWPIFNFTCTNGLEYTYDYEKINFKKVRAKEHLLKEIRSSNTSVKFNTIEDFRKDLDNGYCLGDISIYNGVSLTKKFNFYYSHFESDNSQVFPNIDVKQCNKFRLKLDSLKEESVGGKYLPPYKFAYNNSLLPDRFSTSIDFWGYYNGADNGNRTIPGVMVENSFIDGANRRVDVEKTKACVLESITLPTGGVKSYIYEGNTAKIVRLEEDTYPFAIPKTIAFRDYEMYRQPDGSYILPSFTVEEMVGKPNGILMVQYKCDQEPPSGTPSDPGYKYSVYLFNEHGESFGRMGPTFRLNLDPGEYHLEAYPNPSYEPCPEGTGDSEGFVFDMSWLEVNDTLKENMPVGGLRIKQVEYNPGGNQPALKRTFNYVKLDTIIDAYGRGKHLIYRTSYARIRNYPIFSEVIEIGYNCDDHPNIFYNDILKINSSCVLPMACGSYNVTYAKVEEFDGTNPNSGRKEYKYLWHCDAIDETFPYTPPVVCEWRNGVLLNRKFYFENGDVLAKDEQYSYNMEITGEHSSKCVKIDYVPVYFIEFDNLKQEYVITMMKFDVTEEYEIETGQSLSAGITTIDIFENDSIVSEIDNDYNTQHLLKSSVVTYSDNSTDRTNFYYTLDSSDPDQQALATDKNFVSVPIRTDNFKNGILSESQINLFDANCNLEEEYAYEGKLDISESDTPSDILNTDDHYLARTYKYNGHCSPPVELKDYRGNSICYLWAYHGKIPVAKIINVKYDDLVTLLGESFITDLANSTSDGFIGSKIDELRIALAGMSEVQITSFQYSPEGLLRKVTDPNGQNMHYNYDVFGRLRLVRDNDWNVLKEYEYQYYNSID